MRVPIGWLREFAPTDMAVDELAELMTHRGVKVEGVVRPWAGLDGVVVVRVLEVQSEGRRAMSVRDFLNGAAMRAGDRLETI